MLSISLRRTGDNDRYHLNRYNGAIRRPIEMPHS
jgi:hypothetical protein